MFKLNTTVVLKIQLDLLSLFKTQTKNKIHKTRHFYVFVKDSYVSLKPVSATGDQNATTPACGRCPVHNCAGPLWFLLQVVDG